MRNGISVCACSARLGNLLEKNMWKKEQLKSWAFGSGGTWLEQSQGRHSEIQHDIPRVPLTKVICCIIKSLTDWLKCACRSVPRDLPQPNTADHVTIMWSGCCQIMRYLAGRSTPQSNHLLRLIHFSYQSLFIVIISFYC